MQDDPFAQASKALLVVGPRNRFFGRLISREVDELQFRFRPSISSM